MRVKTRRRHIAAALVAMLALTGCTAAPRVEIDTPGFAGVPFPAETTQQLQDAVTHAMAADGASGAIVGVWAPWSGEWVTGLGTQQVGGGSAVTAGMQFRAGPITRAMTCDALYVLAGKGTVSLDDPVTDYVSGFADLKDVTLEQLCDSTSGIGSYTDQLLSSWLAVPSRVWDPRELASYGTGQARTAQPGAGYRDSDAGYVLLGLALENATGKPAADILDDEVFAPLGLDSTHLPTDASAAVPHVLDGYHSTRDAAGAINCTDPLDVTRMSASFGFTDSGVVTDIDDLGRYARALAAETLAPGVKRFANPLPAYQGAPSWYTTAGGALQAGSLIGGHGSVPGYVTAAFADPATGLTIAVVLNNSGGSPGVAAYLAWELAAIASKAPATAGETAPEAGLPWTAESYHDAITREAVCPLPAG